MEKIFLILILLHFHFSLIPNDIFNNIWKLEINNGEKEIKLKRGVWTKITLELKEIDWFQKSSAYIEDIYTIYNLTISDENINSSVPYLIINASESLSYSFYIGLKCQSTLKDNYEVTFTFNSLYSPDTVKPKSQPLNIKIKLKIANENTIIELEPMMKEMPGESVNFFKLKKEIYNIEEIKIRMKKNNDEKIIINDIVLKPFLNRGEFSKDNSSNHGILFDYPLEAQKNFTERTEYNFSLYIENENEKACFMINPENYIIFFRNDKYIVLEEKDKKAFLCNMEDLTSQYEVTNSIKIKTKIDKFPSILTCYFRPLYSNPDSSENNGIKIFKTFITKENNYEIIINDLEANTEYYSTCELSSTYFIEENRTKINITFGNYKEADKIIKLIPSNDENRIPHCVKFTFKNGLNDKNLFKFKIYGLSKCYTFLKKDEKLSLKYLPTVLCQTTELTSNYGIFCAAPLPLYNLGKYLKKDDKEKFSRHFNEFVDDMKRNYGIQFIKETEIIIDREINEDSIKVWPIKNKIGTDDLYINFKVLSKHIQPLQCFYNEVLSENFTFSLLKKSIYLFTNVNETINVNISNPIKNNMYSLNMICYNDLPNFAIRYKTTGIMNMYTYVYKSTDKEADTDTDTDSDSEEETKEEESKEEENINTKTTIKCNDKKNLLNPRCLKDKIVPIIEKLTTDLPQFLKEIENKVQQFSKIPPKKQKQYLEEINDKFYPSSSQEENYTFLIESLIEKTKYLSYKDCSIYASGSSNKEEDTIKSDNYIKCRQYKQNQLENITKTLIEKLDILNCSNIENIITSKLSEDYEINLKYILILIDELSNNPDSYKEGLSSFLLNTTFCLQENFENYWKSVETKIRSPEKYLNSTISAIKKDVIYIILQTLTNLAKVIHFDEIDGYINKEKTQTGLILNETYIEIQKKIIEFSKELNNFGDGLYDYSGSMFSKIETNKGLSESSDKDLNQIKIPNKNIILNIYSNYMLRINKAETLQILVFDSPFVSVKASKDTEISSDTVNTFISITLYDKNGKEIQIKTIDEKYRPEILYLKDQYSSLKTCFYYNESKKELKDNGLTIIENYDYNGEKYIKCVSSHLTAFTAGTYNFNSIIEGKAVLIIVGGILLGIVIIVLIIIIVKKKKQNKMTRISYDNINSEFNDKEELIES